MLEILSRYDAVGTFFALGVQVQRFPDVVAEAVARGHQIESHTVNHPSLAKLTREAFIAEVVGGDDAIRAAVGDRADPLGCLRPPYGAVDGRTAPLAAELGKVLVMWMSTRRTGGSRARRKLPRTSSPTPIPERSSSCTTAAAATARPSPRSKRSSPSSRRAGTRSAASRRATSLLDSRPTAAARSRRSEVGAVREPPLETARWPARSAACDQIRLGWTVRTMSHAANTDST